MSHLGPTSPRGQLVSEILLTPSQCLDHQLLNDLEAYLLDSLRLERWEGSCEIIQSKLLIKMRLKEDI